jgi:hypothetical protein
MPIGAPNQIKGVPVRAEGLGAELKLRGTGLSVSA